MPPIYTGDLVVTDLANGYFGIVTSCERRAVFLANGLEQFLSPKDWDLMSRIALKMPLFHAGEGPTANFFGVQHSLLIEASRERGVIPMLRPVR